MNALPYVIGGLAALFLFAVAVRVGIRHNQLPDSGTNGEPADASAPRSEWRYARFTAGLRTLVRRARIPSDADREQDSQRLGLLEWEEGTIDPSDPGQPPVPVAVDRPPIPAAVDPPPEPVGTSTNRPIAWLKAVRGPALDVLLTQDEVVVGRDTQCHIVLDEETVSRKHCALLFRSGRWYIRPFRTPNGTYVNDAPVKSEMLSPLRSRDSIGIGPDVVLKITMPEVERIPLYLHTGAATSAGSRDQNEDNFLATAAMVGVADGVGGHAPALWRPRLRSICCAVRLTA